MDKIIAISGPSGAGKTTLTKKLITDHPEFVVSISATTRAPRGEEKDGVAYHFLAVDDFKNKIINGEFVEYEEVYDGLFYGTLKSEIQRIIDTGKKPLLDIDVIGAENLKQIYGQDAETILVLPPSLEILEERLRSRGTDNEDKIKERLERAEFEIAQSKKFDFVIINNDLEIAYQELVGAVIK